MKKIFVFVTLVLVFALQAACSPVVPAAVPVAAAPKPTGAPTQPVVAVAIPEIKVDAADFTYAAPETINAGWVRVILTNSGAEPHHVQFLRLNDGVTVQQFEAALKQAEGPALALTKQLGGVGAFHPGGSASAVLNLPAGQYVILCLIPSPGDHVAHHTKGMIKSLTVRAASGVSAAEPKAGMTVHLKDFSFDMPGSLPAGSLTIRVINDGPEPHELNILRLADGKTLEDVTRFLNGAGGPPPFAPVGGMNGLDVGVTGYAEVNLGSGKYVAICNIPSPKAQGHPHFDLGMIKEFSVGKASASAFPTGKFIKSGTTNYGLVFKADGTFSVFEGDTTFVHGTYRAAGNTFTETSNDGGCDTNRNFTYTFDGTRLTLNYVGDPAADADCTGRHQDFNNVTYTFAK